MLRSLRTLLLGAALGAISSLGVAAATSPARQADLLVSEARMELAELQALIPAAQHSRSAHLRLQSKADALDGTLRSLDRTVAQLQGPPPPRVTSSDELGRIESAIARESFSDDRLAVLRSASEGRRFTSTQVRRLMDQFTFSDDKIAAAVLLFPKVVDQQNWYTVYSALTFGSDKAELRQRTM
ncbi:MAG: hypothetical protein ACI8S6_003606 [Myxococcota bacterium]|jgi:hypothetical protein